MEKVEKRIEGERGEEQRRERREMKEDGKKEKKVDEKRERLREENEGIGKERYRHKTRVGNSESNEG